MLFWHRDSDSGFCSHQFGPRLWQIHVKNCGQLQKLFKHNAGLAPFSRRNALFRRKICIRHALAAIFVIYASLTKTTPFRPSPDEIR
jgi:hypothetical protein